MVEVSIPKTYTAQPPQPLHDLSAPLASAGEDQLAALSGRLFQGDVHSLSGQMRLKQVSPFHNCDAGTIEIILVAGVLQIQFIF